MSAQKTKLTPEEAQEIRDEIYRRWGEWLVEDVYMGGEPLTVERKRALGWPVTAEEALARMRENKRKQEIAKRSAD